MTKREDTEDPDTFLVVILEIDQYYDKMERTYAKVQDLLTNIGGSI